MSYNQAFDRCRLAGYWLTRSTGKNHPAWYVRRDGSAKFNARFDSMKKAVAWCEARATFR